MFVHVVILLILEGKVPSVEIGILYILGISLIIPLCFLILINIFNLFKQMFQYVIRKLDAQYPNFQLVKPPDYLIGKFNMSISSEINIEKPSLSDKVKLKWQTRILYGNFRRFKPRITLRLF